eukprot:maker-scaffold889_size84747-snap-gene-0.26 protein:Tk06037 transcript:maker-scaffold889_size84747-snap-gene-0.26-mRNA-1 annotation:"PREDICTED: uncharacterized protein LOC103314234"
MCGSKRGPLDEALVKGLALGRAHGTGQGSPPIGDVVETGPPTTRRASSASASSHHTAKLKNGYRRSTSASKTLSRQRCHSETASEIRNSEDNLSSSASSLADFHDDVQDPEEGGSNGEVQAPKMKTRIGPKSKTRPLSVDSGSANGTEDSDANGPLSPRTRSIAKQQKRQLRPASPEFDEEVSFSEPPTGLSEEDFGDSPKPATNGHHHSDEDSEAAFDLETSRSSPAPTALPMAESTTTTSSECKKKRKTSAEKFLEDNSDYYGIQVLPTKLRSKITFHKSFLEFLGHTTHRVVKDCTSNGHAFPALGGRQQVRKGSLDTVGTGASNPNEDKPFSQTKQRHKSASETQNGRHRRTRLHSSPGSNGMKDSTETKSVSSSSSTSRRQLRVDVERLHVDEVLKDESEDEGEEAHPPLRSRKSKRQAAAVAAQQMSDRGQDSPSPKRRRTELDKLLEAGSSSFHFETARQACSRENGLGPIHVDVTTSELSSVGPDEAATAQKGVNITKIIVKKRKKLDEDTEGEEESEAEVPLSQGKKKKKGRRRLILTKEDLLDGPLHIAPKEDRSKKVKRRFSKEPNIKDYLPHNLFEDIEERLTRVDPTPMDVNELSFSFEHTPLNEGWFQTYSRQDQGDEILFYPENRWFPLPYEMPASTFYTKKDKECGRTGGKKESTSSGSVTPIELPVKKSARHQTAAKSLRRSVMECRKKEVLPKALLAHSAPLGGDSYRKSPRCHASTKALLTCGATPGEGGEDEVDVEHEPDKASLDLPERDNPLLDECSNDSTFSTSSFSHSRKFKSESHQEMNDLALSLDEFLRDNDPSLEVIQTFEDRPTGLHLKRSKKRRLSGKHSNEDPMDRTVAASVDPLLLDCLEDELPSVCIDEELPGSDPLALIDTFESCDSMIQVCNSRWMRAMATTTSHNKVFKAKRTIASPPTTSAMALDDSSSEYATSVSSSTTSSGKRRVKRKRNLTGFPNPKKKKKIPSLLSNVLTKRTILAVHKTLEDDSATPEADTPKGKRVRVPVIAPPPKDESDEDADDSQSEEEGEASEEDEDVPAPRAGRALRDLSQGKCYKDPDSDLDLGDDLKIPVKRRLKVPKITPSKHTPLRTPKKTEVKKVKKKVLKIPSRATRSRKK